MRFLFICGREIEYTRNQVLLRAFKRLGEVETVVETGIVKSLIGRSARLAIRAYPKYKSQKYDLIFVGFYGHLLMIPIGLISKRPLVFDAFVSTYDTLISDRQNFSKTSIMARAACYLDRFACQLADVVLLDTPAQELYFSSTLKVPVNKLHSLPVSCNEDIFYPRQTSHSHQYTLVLSYSTYLPLHGMETVIQAAEILKGEHIKFKLIGQGPLYKSVHRFAREKGLDNVIFSPPVSLENLADEIASADICLGGHFGGSEKANRVIPGKIYQMLAMGKTIIATQTLANTNILEHELSAYLCSPNNPTELANAIQVLHRDQQLCRKIGEGAHKTYEKYCSEAIVTEKLQHMIIDKIIQNLD